MLERFLADLPRLHSWDEGRTWNEGGFNRWLLEQIHPLIPPHAHIIETGAGNSTIFFLLHAPSRVVSVAPDAALFNRILAYCQKHGISTEPLEAIVEGSQWALPKLAAGSVPQFDIALIDGHHGWPMVFIDFQYVNYMLKEGGLLLIDDIQLYSVAELVALLEEQWGYVQEFRSSKLVGFRKMTDERELKDFGAQPYIMRKSRPAGRITRLFRRLQC